MSITNVVLSFQVDSTGNTSDMHSRGAVFVSQRGSLSWFSTVSPDKSYNKIYGNVCTSGAHYVTAPRTKYTEAVRNSHILLFWNVV